MDGGGGTGVRGEVERDVSRFFKNRMGTSPGELSVQMGQGKRR